MFFTFWITLVYSEYNLLLLSSMFSCPCSCLILYNCTVCSVVVSTHGWHVVRLDQPTASSSAQGQQWTAPQPGPRLVGCGPHRARGSLQPTTSCQACRHLRPQTTSPLHRPLVPHQLDTCPLHQIYPCPLLCQVSVSLLLLTPNTQCERLLHLMIVT